MNKIPVFLLLCVSLFIGCVKDSISPTLEKGVLSVGVEIGYPPMEYYGVDGDLLGFDIDLVKALAEKLELKVIFFDTAWDGILAGLDANRYDIAVNVTILPERRNNYNFTKPYINSFMTIVTRKGSPLKINKIEDIAGVNAAFQGNTTAQYFSERLNSQGVRFTSFSYDKIINCFSDLKLGRVDLVIVDNIAAFYYTGMENSGLQVARAQPDESSDELIGICLKKGNDKLTGMINKALDELTAEGVVGEISRKYFGR
jgi:polar amino acid transport system substrate-binding protein